ncbi:MAG: TonB-dependent receptor plug domain-containing protein [Gemmatimonadaceae bacterium]|nr:TonB-dependent receptor plug domain-containing protein [Gemmatimonadaceae bacterium]
MTYRLVALSLALAGTLPAQSTPDSARSDSSRTLSAVRVTGRRDDLTGVALSAAQGRIGHADLKQRPMVREGEILEVVPGMILTQHSGDGKANQMFLRGFNLDHGTDFQTRIESMPLNLVTHAHGQGYSDLNLLIPELVDHVSYSLGPYYAELGDFGSAGGATLQLVRALPQAFASAEGGAWGYRRLVAAGSETRGAHTWLAGGEVKDYDGPWLIAQGLSKRSGLARYSWQGAGQSLSVLGMSYANHWNASDQIPERGVLQGALDRFGQIDPSLGGQTARHSLSMNFERQRGLVHSTFDAYAVRYDFTLFSNFTYFLDNPASGDQIRQRDHRTIYGIESQQRRVFTLASRAQQWRYGLQTRFDDADVSLGRSADRQLTGIVRADVVWQGSAGMWTSLESQWSRRVRTVLGVRGDAYGFVVRSDRAENSGNRRAFLASPKASLIVRASDGVELYAGGGLGFHSNDARGTTIHTDPVSGDRVSPVEPLVRSTGGELGVRLSGPRDLRTTISLWTLRLNSELLFVGDAGTTEPQGRSARTGFSMANYWRPVSSLALDADVSFTAARYLDAEPTARRVSGALENVIAAGAQWTPVRGGPTAVVRLRHLGAYPLTESNAVRATPTTLVNASVGVPIRGGRLTASLLNALGSRGRDIQYFYASRLSGEPAGGVEDVHFHPVEPRQIRLGISIGDR